MYMQKDTVIMHLICLKAARIACRICLLKKRKENVYKYTYWFWFFFFLLDSKFFFLFFSFFFFFVCVCVQFSQHAIKKHSFKIKYNLDIVLVVDDFVWGYVGVEGLVVALECPEGHHHRDRRRVHCH